MRVLLASFEGRDDDFSDDPAIASALRQRGVDVEIRAWTDPSAGWDDADLVVVRSTWDYTFAYAEFAAWVQARTAPVANDPALILWNCDKRYLADLADAGIPTVPTTFVSPAGRMPPLDGQVVVKPTVSAGGRDTGRFSLDTRDEAQALAARILASGRTAMVQPFIDSVDTRGETAVVVIDGDASHVLRKRAVLRPDEVAPLRADALGAAEAMYDPDLVRLDTATPPELDLADRILGYVRDRFGSTPLHLRVDMLQHDGGPALLELEAVEPHLYLAASDGGVERVASAIMRRLGGTRRSGAPAPVA